MTGFHTGWCQDAVKRSSVSISDTPSNANNRKPEGHGLWLAQEEAMLFWLPNINDLMKGTRSSSQT